MNLSSEEHQSEKDQFQDCLNELYVLLVQKRQETELIDAKLKDLLFKLDNFSLDLLPYSSASRFVYDLQEDGEEYFFADLSKLADTYFKRCPNEDLYIKFIKLFEHLDLASSQKAYLYNKQQQQLSELTEKINEVDKIVKAYEEKRESLETVIKEFSVVKSDVEQMIKSVDDSEDKMNNFDDKIGAFDKNFQGFEDKFKKIEESTNQITVNLISILGIFAAILLGAYGSIQGFSNVFANAKDMSIGKIIMLSSIGGSAVLLILFFLLNSVAKLTNKPYGNGGNSFITKHPIAFFSQCILLVLFVFGGVLELISLEITPEKSWLWLLVFLLILIQILFISHNKSLWGIFIFFSKINVTFIKTLKFLFITMVILLLLAYMSGYINKPIL